MIFLSFPFFALLLLLTPSVPAFAHPEGEILPESVAVMEYRLHLSLAPDDHNVRNKLGIVYIRLEKAEDAEAAFVEVLRRDPVNTDAIDGLGLVALKRGNLAGAEEKFRKAVAGSQNDAMNHYHLGHVLERTGRMAEAEREYRRSVELRATPVNLEALAAICRRTGKAAEALGIETRRASMTMTEEDRKNRLGEGR